jgi:hypothetical protein
MPKHVTPFVYGLIGSLLMLFAYQAYLDHHRIMAVCGQLDTQTAHKITCW